LKLIHLLHRFSRLLGARELGGFRGLLGGKTFHWGGFKKSRNRRLLGTLILQELAKNLLTFPERKKEGRLTSILNRILGA